MSLEYILTGKDAVAQADSVVKELATHMQEYGIREKAPGMIKGISFVKTAVSDHGEINAEPASYIYGIGNLLL